VREPSRYCPNLHEHAHFHDEATGEIHDVDIPADLIARLHNLLPKGYDAVSIDLSFRGSVRALHALTDQQN
jgi:Fur family peroxide stress response transcriptional regulator